MPEERRRRSCGTSAKARLLVEKTIRVRLFLRHTLLARG